MKLFTLLLLLIGNLYAAEESSLPIELDETILPFYNQFEEKQFKGENNLNISYKVFGNSSRTAIVLSPGKSESHIKYAELVYDLKDLDATFFVIDHRGMGFSERMVKDGEIVHVNSFDNYAKDFKKFIATVVKPENYENNFLLCHSMGCAVVTKYMIENKHPFQKAILSSPMWEMNLGSFPKFVAYGLTSTMTFFGYGGDYAVGQGPSVYDFKTNNISSSKNRFDYWVKFMKIYPQISSSGVSNSWINECLSAIDAFRDEIHKIKIPFLIFQAGKDEYVILDTQNEICDKKKNCTIIRHDNAMHEILMETDSIRNPLISEIKSFFAVPE